LPDHISSRLLQSLRLTHPGKLTHAFLVEYFLRGPSITFTSSMTGVSKQTIVAMSEIGPDLIELELSGLDWISDNDFALTIKRCKNLTSLNLRFFSFSHIWYSLHLLILGGLLRPHLKREVQYPPLLGYRRSI
jgi:hypothetical protein